MMKGNVILSNEYEYLDKAKDGVRILFDFYDFRLIDIVRKEVMSYMLTRFDKMGNTETYYELDSELAFNLLALWVMCDKKKFMIGESNKGLRNMFRTVIYDIETEAIKSSDEYGKMSGIGDGYLN